MGTEIGPSWDCAVHDHDRFQGELVVIHVELPGVPKDEIDIQIRDRELAINGETSPPESRKGRHHRSSRRTGRFDSSTLHGDLRADAVSTADRQWSLTCCAESEAAKPRTIEITG